MNKSFVESGGTVLSTNWNKLAKEKVTVNPPDGISLFIFMSNAIQRLKDTDKGVMLNSIQSMLIIQLF